MLGFSGLNDTYYLHIAFNHPSSVRVITYFCLILMPYPALRFFASAAGGKYRAETLVFWLCAANFLTQIILTWTGVSDYFNLVYISHIILLLASAIAIWIVVDAVRKKNDKASSCEKTCFRSICMCTRSWI